MLPGEDNNSSAPTHRIPSHSTEPARRDPSSRERRIVIKPSLDGEGSRCFHAVVMHGFLLDGGHKITERIDYGTVACLFHTNDTAVLDAIRSRRRTIILVA